MRVPLWKFLLILVVLAVIGIVWWAINRMGLPQPMQIVAAVVLAIVAPRMASQTVGTNMPR